MSRWLITNARLVNEGETIETDVRIERGRIDRMDGGLSARPRETVVDARGRLLLPGMIDTHVHFREPGLTRMGNIATESRAAVAGGVTSFLDFPDTRPMTTTRRALADKFSRAHGRSTANYGFYLGATSGNGDEVRATGRSEACGLSICVGGAGLNEAIDDPAMLAALVAESTLLPVLHGENGEIVEANRSRAMSRHGGELPASVHSEIHSREASRAAFDLAAGLPGDKPMHVASVSTGEVAEALNSGEVTQKRLSAGVCLPHLYFMDADYDALGNLIKYDPAIQSDADRSALRRALADDRIDIIASGHAPQLLRDKGPRYTAAASGMPVIQFALPVAWSLVAARMLSPERLVEKVAHNPARRFGLAERGFAREGCWADLVLLETARRCVVDEQSLLSQCAWTPFAGRKLPATVAATWVNGRLVWRDGLLTGQVPGQRLQPRQD
ncbi:amidohydrolase family protein [Wenzhouxiangella sp. EGI_FJ10409]|uniref:amidohydrolase family protein n=1 Tax=Wenzhouxiangella sp. EGI_FJ10409 TaxID=3243767 RepID=UPI0035DDB9ED